MPTNDWKSLNDVVSTSTPTIEYYINHPVISLGTGIILVKDLEHNFVACNSVFSHFSGIHPRKLQGLSDYDMPWAEQSQIYIAHEDAILAGEDYKVIEPLNGCCKSVLHTSKEIIYDCAGRPAGTIAIALLLRKFVEFDNILGVSTIQKVIPYGKLNLSAMETQVLYYALHGKKRQKIADKLNISATTVDTYMRRLKVKFNVASNADLLDKCINSGFHEVFPFQIVTE